MKTVRELAVSRMFWGLIAFAVVMLFFMCLPGCSSKGFWNEAKPVMAVPALPQGHQAPSKAFLEQWQDFATVREEIKQLQKKDHIQDKLDQLNGMGTRLQSQIPQGFTWDEDTLSFKPILSPAAPPAATLPPVAPAKK